MRRENYGKEIKSERQKSKHGQKILSFFLWKTRQRKGQQG